MNTNFATANFERRKHPRFSVDLPVEYRKIDTSKSHPAHTGDVSEGGLLLYVSEPFEIGQELTLKLFFASGAELNSAEAHVRVVWKDVHMENDTPNRIGVKFVEISSADMNSLKGFLNQLINGKSTQKVSLHSGFMMKH